MTLGSGYGFELAQTPPGKSTFRQYYFVSLPGRLNQHPNMYYQGILIGLLSFAIIGIFHPLVVKTEFYYGKHLWIIFLILGVVAITASLLIESVFGSALSGLLGFTCMWTIKEMFEQEERVRKGWFPANPRKKGNTIIRREQPADYDAIRRINEQAFGRLDEAFFVEKLRRNPLFNPALSLVAVKNNIVVGHILFFPAKICSSSGRETEVLTLAPLAVFPGFQQQGIGRSLVDAGIATAKQLGQHHLAAVLGHPEYYPRFGFRKASQYGIQCPFPCPENTLMVLELAAHPLNDISGTIQFPPETAIINKYTTTHHD